MIRVLFTTFLYTIVFSVKAQIGIGTDNPHPSAKMDVTSTNKGFLPPRMTGVQRNAILNPSSGLIVWCLNCGPSGEIEVFNGTRWTNVVGTSSLAYALPTITTTTLTEITLSSAVSGGSVTSDGGGTIVSKGVCWSSSHNNPTIDDRKTSDGTGMDSYTSSLSGLDAETTYYARAYATNSAGTSYGDEQTFTTQKISLTDGLIASYPFNGNANDESGNNYNGTVYGATLSEDRFGNANSAYHFDGSSYILAENTSSPLDQNPRTLSFWFKSNVVDNPANRDIINLGMAGTSQRFGFTMYNGLPFFCGQNNDFFGTGYLGDNNWHNIVITYDGITVSMYVDKVLNSSGQKSLNTVGENIVIGRSPMDHGAPTSFEGSIDDISVWNRVLTGAEITSGYVSPAVLTTNSVTSITSSNASCGGNINSDGGSTISARGVCWSTAQNPTIADRKTSDGTGIGSYTSSLSGLDAETTYYARAYATNSAGTSYGGEQTFTTQKINLTDGLIASYPFNGNANDESGNGNNGVVSNAVLSADRFGVQNSAYLFNGSSSEIIIPNVAQSGNGSRTIIFWINTLSDSQCILSTGNPGASETFNLEIGYDGTNGRIGVMGYFDDFYPSSGKQVNDGKWHMIACTYDGSILKTYADGVLDNWITIGYSTSHQNNIIGRSNHIGAERYFNGLIDDISIYTRALREQEIANIFNSTACITTIPISSISFISATSGGNILSDGGNSIITRGVCWSTGQNPTINGNKTSDGAGTGIFASSITGLTPGTLYYLRAYATNSSGTFYGNEVSFTTQEINLMNGLIASYPFNGNANDGSGNNYNGTVYGATLSEDRFGNGNSSYHFDGNSYIDLGNITTLGLTNLSVISISFWSLETSGNIISKYINFSIPDCSFYIGKSATSIGFSGDGTNRVNTPISDNTWTHYVFIGASGMDNCKIYRNGTLIASGTLNVNSTIPSTNVMLGRVADSFYPGYLTGTIDDIYIFNRVLSQDQINYLFTH